MTDLTKDELWSSIIPQVLRVPVTAYNNRQRLQRWWTHLSHLSGKGDTNIVVTGRSAVGKSLLSCRMRGIANDLTFKLPSLSTEVESSVISVGDWARIVRVIPGQTSREQDLGFHEAFSKHNHLAGVIHVVDWGYTPIRDATIRQKLIKEDGIETIERIRQYNLKIELNILKSLCDRIRESSVRCQRPKWLLIAVNKADLFLDSLDSAQNYYHPKLNSDFTKIINNLLSQVGSQNLLCKAIPTSS